ncbi:MAG TPA: hypothetical protein VH062_20895 [Polyangiaceae bacterium]|jgi:hypothetical protein|nr:hypothetical protein [Polyangiaceae bacterium]
MSFGEEQLEAEDRRVVADYWFSRAQGEMTSWVGFQHVLADLKAEASPAAVVELAERAVVDEYRHSEWCNEWARRYGHHGAAVKPRALRAIEFPGATPEENRLLRIALCCFTESVGCFTLRLSRERLVDVGLRKQNQVHLSDELRHSRVGWAHLSTLDERKRELVARFLPVLDRALRIACCEGTELDREELVAHGYFTPRLLREAYEGAMTEVIVPGLRHLKIAGAAS